MSVYDEVGQRLLPLRQKREPREESEAFGGNCVLALQLDVVNVFGRCNLHSQILNFKWPMNKDEWKWFLLM